MKTIFQLTLLGLLLGIFLVNLGFGKQLFVEKRIIYVPQTYRYPTETEVMQEIVKQFSDMGATGVWLALRIAQCESRFRPDAFNVNTNNTHDSGVYQLNSRGVGKGYAKEILFDYRKNIQIAHNYVKQNGWGAWVCYRKV